MTDPTQVLVEYRLSYDMPDLTQLSRVENRYGKDVWERASEQDLDKMTWRHHEEISGDLANLADRRAILELWRVSYACPVRNLKFERRVFEEPWYEI